VAVLRGMQESGDPKWPLKIHATLKHYTAYSVESNRFGYIGNTTLYDVFDSFLPQYQAGFVEGKAAGVMCSYMSLKIGDGAAAPSCGSDFLLNHMVRSVWGAEDALIVSDCEAVESEYEHNHLAKDCPTAAAMSMNAGCDLNTGHPYFQSGYSLFLFSSLSFLLVADSSLATGV
jgi:beta-D-xylosidase 4